ncbi:MAG: SMC-Scp complex subunit ScpB [Patescibacteria group bacterium]
MANLEAQLEACLFVATKPVSIKELAKITQVSETEVAAVLKEMLQTRQTNAAGIQLLLLDGAAQLVTSPECAEVVARIAKEEVAPELTRPSLEALTIIAYRGPVTKPEIEAIRGVNCSLILRNLLMRGLVEESEDARRMQTVYTISTDTLRFLGLHEEKELPDYQTLHANAHIDKLLEAVMTPSETQDGSVPVSD